MAPAIAVGLGSLSLLGAVDAASALRVERVRFGDHPAFVRVVVDLAGGVIPRMGVGERIPALDSSPTDGVARVRISDATRTKVRAADGEGVRVIVRRAGNGNVRKRVTLVLRSDRARFKYLDTFVLDNPERLVIDLWKRRPPAAGSVQSRRQRGCPALDRFSVRAGSVSTAGRVGSLFESSFSLRLRNAAGRVVREQEVLSEPGRWSAGFGYRVAERQRGTLELFVGSAIDGTVQCLTQVGTTLTPR